jgi:hypothetical protein
MSGANDVREITIKTRGWPTPKNLVGVQIAPCKRNQMSRKEKRQMSKMKLALDVATDLRNLAGSIETLLLALEDNQSMPAASVNNMEETKEPGKPAQTAQPKLPTLEEVRAKLASLSQDGKQAQVKALITEFGAKKLSDIPAGKYAELLKKAEEL